MVGGALALVAEWLLKQQVPETNAAAPCKCAVSFVVDRAPITAVAPRTAGGADQGRDGAPAARDETRGAGDGMPVVLYSARGPSQTHGVRGGALNVSAAHCL